MHRGQSDNLRHHNDMGACAGLPPILTAANPTSDRLQLPTVYAGDVAEPMWGCLAGDRLRIHRRQ
jgi:hypothetical protein